MKPVHILLAEDNEGDIVLTLEALEEGKMINTVDVVRDGKEAIDYLNKTGRFKDAVTPDFVLLDINLPKKNGQEVLRYIKTNDILKHIPVIILTTSSSEKDIEQSYNNYANCYITKPVDMNEFINAILKVEDFWINIVKLPNSQK